jgi:rhodanese-related sulfurtransferase
MSPHGDTTFAGDLSLEDAYALLAKDGRAVLVDVRTEPEWQFVGVPDLTPLGRMPIFKQWQIYPSMEAAPDFVERLAEDLRQRGADAATPLIFLCRSGARSRHAARAMTSAGWSRCYNIAEGFEGVLDDNRHRGKLNGWQARAFPWKQT